MLRTVEDEAGNGWMDEEEEGRRLCPYASVHCLVFNQANELFFGLNFLNILMVDSRCYMAETNKICKAIILQFKNTFK